MESNIIFSLAGEIMNNDYNNDNGGYEVDIIETNEISQLETFEDVVKRGIFDNERNRYVYVSFRNQISILSTIALTLMHKIKNKNISSVSDVFRYATMYGVSILDTNADFCRVKELIPLLIDNLSEDAFELATASIGKFEFKSKTKIGTGKIPTLLWVDGWSQSNENRLVFGSKTIQVASILGLSKSECNINDWLKEKLKLEENWIYAYLKHNRQNLEKYIYKQRL